MKILAISVGLLFSFTALAQRPLGIDVSHFQGTALDWPGIKAAGLTYAYCKATQSTGYTDPTFTLNANGARSAGVYFGAYHFSNPDINLGLAGADAEAAHFWNVAGGYINGSATYMMPMLDFEQAPGSTYTKTTLSAWANRWCQDIVADASNSCVTVKPIVYTFVSYANSWCDTTVTQWPLWMASPNGKDPLTAAPNSVAPWSDWTFWQYGGAIVPGAPSAVDRDVFNGTSTSLGNYVIGGLIPGADLAVTIASTTNTSVVGNEITYNITITNQGPTNATSVKFIDNFPIGATLQNLSQSHGTFSNTATAIYLNFGILTNGGLATASLTFATTQIGGATNSGVVVANEMDTALCNNSATAAIAITPPPPMISGQNISTRATSAFVSWTTYSNATAQIAYGLTTNLTLASSLNPTLTTNHMVWLTGLQTNTVYYYRISSVAGGVTYTTNGSFATAGTSFIVDNPDALYSGPWVLSTAAADKYGSSYIVCATTTNYLSITNCYFRPNLPLTGFYDVYLWYPQIVNNTTNAAVYLSGNAGQVALHINQTVGTGQWTLLATNFSFSAGTNGYIMLSNYTGETNRSLMADAARWVYNPAQEIPADGTVPSWWTQTYFGANAAGSADTDGDGYSNYQEFVLGTAPNDSTGKLNVRVDRLPPNLTQVTFTPWQGARVYQLQRATNLFNPIWQTLTNQPAVITNGEGTFTLTNTSTNSFYRLMTRLAP